LTRAVAWTCWTSPGSRRCSPAPCPERAAFSPRGVEACGRWHSGRSVRKNAEAGTG
jgi:hypothetical protein